MPSKFLLPAVLLVAACSAPPPKCTPNGAVATPGPTGPVRVVRVLLSPPDARVSVKGEVIDHPAGYVDLPGPIGYTFVVDVDSGDARTSRQVLVTDAGASPAQISLVAAPTPILPPSELDRTSSDLARAFRDAPARPSNEDRDLQIAINGTGQSQLMIACYPACEHVFDNGVDLGPSPVARTASPGRHRLEFVARGRRKSRVIDVPSGALQPVRVVMDEPANVPSTRD